MPGDPPSAWDSPSAGHVPSLSIRRSVPGDLPSVDSSQSLNAEGPNADLSGLRASIAGWRCGDMSVEAGRVSVEAGRVSVEAGRVSVEAGRRGRTAALTSRMEHSVFNDREDLRASRRSLHGVAVDRSAA
jgi:hypothetical protein